MKDELYTPFGIFRVKQNDQVIKFLCTNKVYFPSKSKESIRLYMIEVDMSQMAIGDIITYGLETTTLKNVTKEKTDTILLLENEELVFGLSNSVAAKEEDLIYSYQIEKKEDKLTFVLCCIEKNKIKNAKNVVKEIINNDSDKVDTTYQVTTKRKPKKIVVTMLLFFLFTMIYTFLIYILMQYQVIAKPELKKYGAGLVGVLLISYVLSYIPNSQVEKKHTKKNFIISLCLLIILCISLGINSFLILTATGRIKDPIILGIGIVIVLFALLGWFVSDYKIDQKKKDILTLPKEEPIKTNPILQELFRSFPKSLKNEWLTISSRIQIEHKENLISKETIEYQLNGETIVIPYRIYFDEVSGNFTELERLMLYCLYTRHYDGHIREKYVNKLLETELLEWQIPFLVGLGADYVVEIIATIYNKRKDKNNDLIKNFVKNNKQIIYHQYLQMINYWNLYYLETYPRFHQYVGRKLFRECFGYSRKYEKKKYKCACCGNNTIHGFLINYYNTPCPVCHWQNNLEQNNNSKLICGINPVSLNEARKNYVAIGAIDEQSVSKVRKPLETEKEIINVARLLKYLKLNLIQMGCIRKKDQIHPFYEYQNQYFRIVFSKETNELVLETTKTMEKARNNEWKECKKYDIYSDKEKLFKDISSAIKKQTKPKKLTKAEKTEIIKEEINKWDPVGLIKVGASEDEYHVEITKIASKISKLETKEELGKHIEEIFQKMFGENIFKNKKKEVEKVAEQILKRIKSV